MMCWIPGIKSSMHKCFVKMRVEKKKRQVAPCQQLAPNVLTKDYCSAMIHYDRRCKRERERERVIAFFEMKKTIGTDKS